MDQNNVNAPKPLFELTSTVGMVLKAGWTAGFIEFTFSGSNDRPGGAVYGANNENRYTVSHPTIGAARSLNKDALQVKQLIERRIREMKQTATRPEQVFSVADELGKFKALLDAGVLTPDEFARKKRELLGS